MFAHHEARDRVDVAFTDRHGGVSGGPHASLDLGDASGDLTANLERVAEEFTGRRDARLELMSQVHGCDVAVVGPDSASRPVADALVTDLPNVVLVVRAADCVPVLLADAERGVVGAVHAGRSGLVAGVVPRAVAAMRDLGAGSLVAWLGPHVCGSCYEVPEQMRDEIATVVPESSAETSWGTPALDLGAGVAAQLRAESVELTHVSRRCTREDEDLYSYRRQGAQSGRLAGLVRVRP